MQRISPFWYEVIGYAGVLGIGVSILIVAGYTLRVLTIKSQVGKFEFVSKKEVYYLKRASIIFSIALTFFVFDKISGIIGLVEGYEFYFVGFVAIGIGAMVGYALFEYLKVYYPFILERRLSRIRFKPRRSPKTGKLLKLLNELEEDIHLTQEMIDHENDYKYDYDVWVDVDTGYKLIERYDGHLRSVICPNCNFRTMKDYKEEMVKSPTHSEHGILKKHYKCSFCEYSEVREIRIPSLKSSQASLVDKQ